MSVFSPKSPRVRRSRSQRLVLTASPVWTVSRPPGWRVSVPELNPICPRLSAPMKRAALGVQRKAERAERGAAGLRLGGAGSRPSLPCAPSGAGAPHPHLFLRVLAPASGARSGSSQAHCALPPAQPPGAVASIALRKGRRAGPAVSGEKVVCLPPERPGLGALAPPLRLAESRRETALPRLWGLSERRFVLPLAERRPNSLRLS